MISTRRRPRPPTESDLIPESIFDVIGPEPKAVDKGPKEPTIKDLMERLGALEGRNKELERERDYEAMRPAPQPVVQVAEEPVPQLNLKDLPDPVAQPEKYAGEVAQRSIKYQDDMRAYQAKKNAPAAGPTGDYDALWAEFSEQHPEYAADDTRTRFAVGEVAKKLGRKGVDMNRYIFARSESFFKDITSEYDKVFGKPETDDEFDFKPAPAPKTKRAAPTISDDDDDGRAASIPGGGDNPGGRASAQGKPPPGDFIKDLTDMQRKSGYFCGR